MKGNVPTGGLRVRENGGTRHRPGAFVDLHCHCLPGIDDGAPTLRAAVALCRMLREDNVGRVVATPHQLGRFEDRATGSTIREAVQALNEELHHRGVDLQVLPGAEVRLDERIERFLANDDILTLADRRQHILLELPRDVFINIEPLLRHLHYAGIEVIIAHPERNAPLLGRFGILQRWVAEGVGLQVTAASLVGLWGPAVQLAAWNLVAEGSVGLIATDAHDAGINRPCMTAAFRAVAARFGTELARLLCIVNPARVVSGERLISMSSGVRQEVR